ncbi:MAG: hypothetical protein ACOC0N_00555 [Chroococcales cyanobacterium]
MGKTLENVIFSVEALNSSDFFTFIPGKEHLANIEMDNSSEQHRQEMNFLANSESPKGTIYI